MSHVLECSVALILEKQLGLEILQVRTDPIHLRIHVSANHENVLPAIVVEIHKCVAPSDVASRASTNSSEHRNIREVHSPVIPIERGIFVIEMRNQNGHASCMEIIAQGNPHVGLARSAFAQSYAGGESDLIEGAPAVLLIKIVRLAVIGDKQIEFASVVEVRPDCRQAIPIFLV